MFLKADQEKAEREVDCYDYCLGLATEKLKQEEFGEASAYLDNASRSLKELERMKIAKQTFDQSWFEIKQIEGQQHVDKVIAEMRSRI
ncbi:hypothetical protein [Virgibacillus sp. CBA3643]|uniref:hypothetical protein n=1 Tax=Virgibacillus sp. CBA3643 TaxID=2942278 RepID=UPI0035A2CD9C